MFCDFVPTKPWLPVLARLSLAITHLNAFSSGHCSFFLPLLRTRTWILQLSPKDFWTGDLSVRDFERELIDLSPQPLAYNSKILKLQKVRVFTELIGEGGNPSPNLCEAADGLDSSSLVWRIICECP